ncbi:GH23948 [Drosophila grimshawi]|uniref:GH23948 n=1 Tax=Drosophila grimshawi TaxID=7222 RepID=B4JZS3_DROGR|nr:GH23948 [Drosophila grimshawi]
MCVVIRVALTTVLLINQDNLGHGRFLSVRPELGLLTSTARTFIQEGITTEYATQVVGTTLNNGRQYAQYLKKSSRVLYENGLQPSVITSWVGEGSTATAETPATFTAHLESHNDLLSDAEAADWRAIDDKLRNVEFVGNTDYFRLQQSSQLLQSTPDSGVFASSVLSTVIHSVYAAPNQNNARILAAQKVLPIGDLPTFTVKNNFAPSGYQNTAETEIGEAGEGEEGRSAKLYHQQLMQQKQQNKFQNSTQIQFKKRVLATITYYGFADFTTLVGDSLIVFSPSTVQASLNLGHITSIKGMATLRSSELELFPSTAAEILVKTTNILSTLDKVTTTTTSPNLEEEKKPFSVGSVVEEIGKSSAGLEIKTEPVFVEHMEATSIKPQLEIRKYWRYMHRYPGHKLKAKIKGRLKFLRKELKLKELKKLKIRER